MNADVSGEDTPAGIFIKSLEFADKTRIVLQDNSIIVFVGPNNSGKSLSLREIGGLLADASFRGKCISKVESQKIGGTPQLLSTLRKSGTQTGVNFKIASSTVDSLSPSDAEKIWTSDSPSIGKLAEFFVSHLTTSQRLADCLPVENVNTIDSRFQKYHPIHSLYLDSRLERRISDLFRRAFGTDLIVHRAAGNKIPLFAGNRPPREPEEETISRSYLDKIEALEALENHGDGFKSFASILLRVWTGTHTVLLLDEPEAFLHPPQARAIGELISADAEYEKQIFIATHSVDVIQGLLSKFPDRVSVIRLERRDLSSSATFLPSEKIAELWRDPILRYSNVLSGLFHTRVVLTEADADCRFYEAIADGQPSGTGTTFYTYSGGKQRMATIIKALRALHVPVKSVVDFDVFSENEVLQRLVEASGGSWTDYRDDVVGVRNIITQRKGWLIGLGFKERVSGILASISDNEVVSKIALSQIRAASREASPWDYLKSAGMAVVPPGDPTTRVLNLMRRLKASGIIVVPVGEMEGFCRSVGGHGPKWVEAVLSRNISDDDELSEARRFVLSFSEECVTDYRPSSDQRTVARRFSKEQFLNLQSPFHMLIRSLGNVFRTLFFAALAANFIYIAIVSILKLYIGSGS